ncbi:MAG: rRNA maturation RNase YbeY [Candidatus Omnitrophota bacterium]|nr:rRNA maturation RNase YbeY [Candidatus Omnitrophota bacterium]
MRITLKNLQNKLPIHSGKIKKLILKVLKGEKVKESGWINICFVDNPQIKKFNAKFLKTKGSTDVLAFNLSDKKEKNIILADIMISAQAALNQARNFKTTPDYELSLYVVHGILHILGFNDHTREQIKLMRKKESQYVY